jgi:phage I-like protein
MGLMPQRCLNRRISGKALMEPHITFLAACSALPLGADNAVPEWLMLIPAGTSQGVDGRGPYINDKPDVVVATSLEGGRPIPFDYNHQTVFAALNGSPSPASGWIDKLENRDGAIWGHVDWTDAGRQAVASREYRYVSPAFHYDAKGHVTKLVSSGLVNAPNLRELPAINAQLSAILPNPGEKKSMDETQRARLAAAYGLPADTTAEALVAHAETHRQVATSAPDPSKFVPIAAFTELQTTVATLQQTAASTHAANLVEGALKSGKLTPAMKDWGLAYASQDPDGFEKYLAAVVPIIVPGTDPNLTDKDQVVTHASGLNAQELAVCSQLGLTPEAYAATKKVA